MGRARTPSGSSTVVPDSEPGRIQILASVELCAVVCHSSTPPASSPCPPPRTMPVTYGRPRPAPSNPTLSLEPTPRINSPTSRSPSPEFRQSWKDDIAAIDNGTYDGEVVHEPKSSSLTPLVSLSSLAPTDSQPERAEPLPRSSPPSSPAPAYRDPEHTDDPDTSVELNTTLTGPSSDAEDQPMAGSAEGKDDDSDEEPAVRRRSGKPLRVLESDSEEEENPADIKLAGKSGARAPVANTSSAMSSGNNLSQLSLERPGVRSSTATTPASVPRKPIKLALSDDEDSDAGDENGGIQEAVDHIEDASSPNLSRSTRNKVRIIWPLRHSSYSIADLYIKSGAEQGGKG